MANIPRISVSQYMRNISANSRRSEAYKRSWRNNASKVEAFGKYLGKTMYSNSFTASIMEEYISWLKSQPKQYKTLTVRGFCSRLGEALRKAGKDGYKVDFGFETIEIPNEEPCTVALTEAEVLNVFSVKKLSREAHAARERFVVACCTGLRHSDIKELSETMVNETIKITPYKTRNKGIRVELPVHWMVRAILKRNGGRMPDIASDQAYNATVKRVCKKAGVDSLVLYEQQHGTKLVRKNVPKYTMVSSHTARRTLATNLYLQGVATAKIMLLTGHTTEQSFFKYIRISRAENAKELSLHPFFAGKNAGMLKKEVEPIGKQIAIKRKIAGLTQPQFAQKLGLGIDIIKSYETGRRIPSIEVLKKIAEVLECTLNISLD